MARLKKPNQMTLGDSIRARVTSAQLAKPDELTLEHGLSRSIAIRELIEAGEVKIRERLGLRHEAIMLLRRTGGLLAALLRKFLTEAKDLQAPPGQALRLAGCCSGEGGEL